MGLMYDLIFRGKCQVNGGCLLVKIEPQRHRGTEVQDHREDAKYAEMREEGRERIYGYMDGDQIQLNPSPPP